MKNTLCFRMLLVTKGHHETDEGKTPDRVKLQDIGQVSGNRFAWYYTWYYIRFAT